MSTERIERIARLIAFWHGQRIVSIGPYPYGARTIAARRGFNSGWSWELDRYVDAHWPEYTSAATALIREFEPDYVG